VRQTTSLRHHHPRHGSVRAFSWRRAPAATLPCALLLAWPLQQLSASCSTTSLLAGASPASSSMPQPPSRAAFSRPNTSFDAAWPRAAGWHLRRRMVQTPGHLLGRLSRFQLRWMSSLRVYCVSRPARAICDSGWHGSAASAPASCSWALSSRCRSAARPPVRPPGFAIPARRGRRRRRGGAASALEEVGGVGVALGLVVLASWPVTLVCALISLCSWSLKNRILRGFWAVARPMIEHVEHHVPAD
jgi:hypothetical protein